MTHEKHIQEARKRFDELTRLSALEAISKHLKIAYREDLDDPDEVSFNKLFQQLDHATAARSWH